MKSLNWDAITLVVFDVDGTLYDQKKLRWRMARDLLLQCLTRADTRTLAILRCYRKLRERLGDEEVVDFDSVLLAQTATRCGVSTMQVTNVVEEWIERRPLPYMATCRFDGVAELFSGLRANGKRIAILSDYPAQAKLQAFGLVADFIVCASDPEVGILKPHPRGLAHVMALAEASNAATLMIGDRIERDGEAAHRLGVASLIKARQPIAGWSTFASYRDPVFEGQY